MRRKHKKGVVSSVYDYIFFLHPSSSDPRATILLLSDAGCLTMYKRARYSRPILNLAFACSIIRHAHTHTHTHYTHRENYVFCAPVLRESWMVVGESRGPPCPVKGCDRLTQKALCPPSTFRTIMLAVKERFESNQVSLRAQGATRRRHMLNALAKHR